MSGEGIVYPTGCKDGKVALLVVSVLGEFVQGAQIAQLPAALPSRTANRRSLA